MTPALPATLASPAAVTVPAEALADLPILAGLRPGARLQAPAEALAQDAQEYARQHGVTFQEAMRRLRAQQESVAATDRIAGAYAGRLAGIAIEHEPAYRIVVLLTGSEPVADESVEAGGMTVPIVFRTGAAATREALLAAIRQHRDEIRAALPGPAGIGLDPRTGELLIRLKAAIAGATDVGLLAAELTALTGVPVRISLLGRVEANMAATGGARVEGVNPATGKRAACTTGFVVTDASRTGVVTAAHCPYTLTYLDPAGGTIPLSFVGAWGARYQDVQVQISGEPLSPVFYADTAKNAARMVTSWRNRASTRAGDVVCHRGERTGYSCSQVELTDYAPPGDLCGGPCDPVWVTVAGPSCKGGDSGGPVFSGTIAFGILKGGSYRRDGTCDFYYYMSTDYLPTGWSLLHR